MNPIARLRRYLATPLINTVMYEPVRPDVSYGAQRAILLERFLQATPTAHVVDARLDFITEPTGEKKARLRVTYSVTQT